MNWTMMADTNVKHQCYQHPLPPCQGGPSPIQAHSAPVSDSFGIAASGRILPELADDGLRAERPILFSGAMVRAILEGRKTQTRRILRGSTEFKGPYNPAYLECHKNAAGWKQICPYGKPGDLLWLRETFALENYTEFPDQVPSDGRPVKRVDCGDYESIHIARYRATEEADLACEHERCIGGPCQSPWTPSIHMPRWASRITLEITDVRVERVQDISETDAYAEGCDDSGHPYLSPFGGRAVVNNFASLWNSINEKRGYGWDKNPFVWVVSFRRAERAA